ncbi:MAG: RNA polymerase sigma factor [Solirubrobacteraceae bacterium]
MTSDYAPGAGGTVERDERPPDALLYDAYARRLERIVASRVRTAHENVEDACHFAWSRYLSRAHEIDPGAARSWLAVTAIRQAWKLDSRQRRDISLEATPVGAIPARELRLVSSLPGPAERAEQHERLDSLSSLPGRQRRLVWLRAAGLSHVEMAAYTGDTVRTVERQIVRATQRMRELTAESAASARLVQRAAPVSLPTEPAVLRRPTYDDRGIER